MSEYADVEAALVVWLPTRVTATVVADLPPDLEDRLPLIRVLRVGGPHDGVLDRPRVAFDCHAVDRSAAFDLAAEVHTAVLTQLHGQRVDDAIFGPSSNSAAFVSVDDPDETRYRRFVGEYQLAVHQRRTRT